MQTCLVPARTDSGSRTLRPNPNVQDEAEELVNAATHGMGLVLSVAGLYALAVITGRDASSGRAFACAVYGVSMVLLYAASTLYHGWRPDRGKRLLLLFDYIGIYLLIAGTYTPMMVIPLGGPGGLVMLALVWGFALIGSAWKVRRFHRFEEDTPVPYLVMSGIWLVATRDVVAAIPTTEFLWLAAGGAFYIGGLYFFVNADRRFYHAVWHVFVLAGSICHFRAVVGCVLAKA